jgi:mRNA interferase HigB
MWWLAMPLRPSLPEQGAEGKSSMHVISKKKLQSFFQKHPKSRDTLLAWHKLICESQFSSPEELRRSFAQVDYVKPFHVFNIGDAFRLIAAIHFNRQKVFVRHVLTHAEYDRGNWKAK